jgi:hypothetical protein
MRTSSLTDMEMNWMSMSTPPRATNLRCNIGVAHRSRAFWENCNHVKVIHRQGYCRAKRNTEVFDRAGGRGNNRAQKLTQ